MTSVSQNPSDQQGRQTRLAGMTVKLLDAPDEHKTLEQLNREMAAESAQMSAGSGSLLTSCTISTKAATSASQRPVLIFTRACLQTN
jgi:hypothetical protein